MAGHYRRHEMYMPGYQMDRLEYPGYNNRWIIGQHGEASSHVNDYNEFSNYGNYPYYERSRSEDYAHSHNDHSGRAHLAWATEIPARLRVTICCDECKMKLDRALRDLDGVHDVGISGGTHAMVTVTGVAPERKILKKARKITKSAELWNDSEYHDHGYAHGRH